MGTECARTYGRECHVNTNGLRSGVDEQPRTKFCPPACVFSFRKKEYNEKFKKMTFV